MQGIHNIFNKAQHKNEQKIFRWSIFVFKRLFLQGYDNIKNKYNERAMLCN